MSDRRQDPEQRQGLGILQKVKKSLDSQKDMTEKQLAELKNSIESGEQKEVDRKLLIDALKDMTESIDGDKNQDQLIKLNNHIRSLKKMEQQKLSSDLYMNPMSDLMEGLVIVNKELNSNMESMKGIVYSGVTTGIGRITSTFSSAFGPLMDLKNIATGLFETVSGIATGFLLPMLRYIIGKRRTARIENQANMAQFSQVNSLKDVSKNIGSMHEIQKDQLKIDEARWRRERRTSESGDKGQRLWPYLLPW